MGRLPINPEHWKEALAQTRRIEQEIVKSTGWRPGDPISISRTEEMDMREEAAHVSQVEDRR